MDDGSVLVTSNPPIEASICIPIPSFVLLPPPPHRHRRRKKRQRRMDFYRKYFRPPPPPTIPLVPLAFTSAPTRTLNRSCGSINTRDPPDRKRRLRLNS
jgi:hypothetical protein